MGNPYIARDDIIKEIRAAFTRRDPRYPDKRAYLDGKAGELQTRIATRERAGEAMTCSQQKLDEAVWLVHYTDDWRRAETELAAAETSLDADQSHAGRQDPADGSWGACCGEWYRKLEPTVDALQSGIDPTTVAPLAFMARLAKTPSVMAYLWRLQITDIDGSGVNCRDELGAVQTALSQLLFKDELHALFTEHDLGFRFAPDLEAAYRDYLAQTQHPRTGYWGPWYRFQDELVMPQDLSFTFHVVNYRRGDITNWPLVIDTTLEIKDFLYPYGWRPSRTAPYNLHNSYDVAQIFAYGWPHMDWEQKGKVRAEIGLMLAWCLTEAIRDGVFVEDDEDPVEIYYFGVRLLDTIGFWRADKRFWYVGAPPVPAGSPSAQSLCRSLKRRFLAIDNHSETAREVLAILTLAEAATLPTDALSAML